MRLPTKSRPILLTGFIVCMLAIGSLMVVNFKRFGEFERAEGLKGYWASLQDFVKQNGRYPKDDPEITAFFHTIPGNEHVEYVAPKNVSADEVVLWCKQKTMFGVRMGITESGMVIKR